MVASLLLTSVMAEAEEGALESDAKQPPLPDRRLCRIRVPGVGRLLPRTEQLVGRFRLGEPVGRFRSVAGCRGPEVVHQAIAVSSESRGVGQCCFRSGGKCRCGPVT